MSEYDSRPMSLFVTCGTGIEPLLLAELQDLGFGHCRVGFRGVYVDNAHMSDIFHINYCSRLAGRVLLPLVRFRCRDKAALYRAVSSINWRRYFRRGTTFAIDANVHHPMLRNSLFAAQIAKDAICDQLREATGERPSVELKEPDLQLNLYVHNQEAVLSFDTSGQSLHKRGYRQEAGEAPLQETLAAALLTLANYQASDVMIDPCCGSGTLLIEAALMASRTAPGYLRKKWGFMALPEFVHEEWLKVKNEADAVRIPLQDKKFFGCEINGSMQRICRLNLKAAGFLNQVEVVRTDFADYTPPEMPTLLVTNPPHGIRMMDVAPLCPLYRRLGDFMKQKIAKPGRGFVFVGDPTLAKEVGLAACRRHVLLNGGIDSRLLEFEIF
jgi:putative N6-adenine-specific DNA methylase